MIIDNFKKTEIRLEPTGSLMDIPKHISKTPESHVFHGIMLRALQVSLQSFNRFADTRLGRDSALGQHSTGVIKMLLFTSNRNYGKQVHGNNKDYCYSSFRALRSPDNDSDFTMTPCGLHENKDGG
jgi:hypothetical protein